MATRGLRTLRLDEAVYRWRVYHRHAKAPARCAEVFAAFLDGTPRAPLRVFFPESSSAGAGHPRQSGVVVDRRAPGWSAELHRPKSAAALIRLGRACGWSPESAPRREHVVENGFDLLRAHLEALE